MNCLLFFVVSATISVISLLWLGAVTNYKIYIANSLNVVRARGHFSTKGITVEICNADRD